MRWRPLHLAILIFQFAWLNIIVPGHRRGMVQMPGSQAVCPCCCCGCPATTNSPNSKAPVNNTGNCAICNFMAHLTIPPVVDFSLAPLSLLQRIAPDRARSVASRRVLLPFDDRGPPLAA